MRSLELPYARDAIFILPMEEYHMLTYSESRLRIVLVGILFGLGWNFAITSSPVLANDVSDEKQAPNAREELLLARIAVLEQRLNELENKVGSAVKPAIYTPDRFDNSIQETETLSQIETQAASESSSFLSKATFNFGLDGYYEYNFNNPVARLNLLRAYDVLSNSFSLNQAALVMERQPDPGKTNVFGLRVDLQYGQATETVQGNANNELRPQAYRPIWQAYGTYIAAVGKGLNIDFGKFASSLGYETNYTKDDWNYSRSYFFNFLPFYHFGFRIKYPVNEKFTLLYHLMNGAQQSEDFNSFKSQHFAVVVTPSKNVTWQVNYYLGKEQRNVVPILNPTFPTLPTQPGLPTEQIDPAPNGKFQVFDTYVTWNTTNKLTFAAEGDYVTNRVEENSAKSVVYGGVLYARYQFTPLFALAGRAEYLSDKDAFFSGVSQDLKETTLSADFRIADGFIIRGEWRRDFSNVPFFLSDTSGVLEKDQNTIGAGLIWWVGGKEGSW